MACDGSMLVGVLVPALPYDILFGNKSTEGTFAWEDAGISDSPI